MNGQRPGQIAADDFRGLLGEAVSWRIFGLLFERPKGSWSDELRSMASETPDAALAALARRAAMEGSESLFLAMLGPGGIASGREVGYRGISDPGQLLARLQLLYGSFAYIPRVEEPPDHVSVEAGFVGYLRLKQGYAIVREDGRSAAVAREAADLFLAEHLGPLAVGLRSRLANTRENYLRAGAHHLYSRVEALVPDGLPEVLACEPESEATDFCGGDCPSDAAPPANAGLL